MLLAAFQLARLLTCRVNSTHPLDPSVFQALKAQLSPALHPSRILPWLQSRFPESEQFPQYFPDYSSLSTLCPL